jgi:hypothetical protein
LIAPSGQSSVGWGLNMMPVAAPQPDQMGIDAVIVEL